MKSPREKGAVALETVMVIGLWFFVAFLFLNILFILSSASLAQSGINRFALEVGSLGCLPPNASEAVQDKIPTFASRITGVEAQTWSSLEDFDDGFDGDDLAGCLDETEDGVADLGAPVRVAVQYEQNILVPGLFLPSGDTFLEVSRSTTVTSSRIESGDLEDLSGGGG